MRSHVISLTVVTSLLLVASACTPSRSQVFGPVATAASNRTGYQITWRSPMMNDARIRGQITELMAGGLTIEEAIRIGLLNSRRLQAAFDQLGVAGGELATASVLRNPEVDAAVRFHGDDDPSIEIEAVQDIMSLIAIGRRRGVARAELEAARIDAIGAVVDLVADVRAAYYAAQIAEQELLLRRTIAEATEASYLLAQQLREAGNVTELDLLRERDLYEQSRIELTFAEAERSRARERLSSLLGLWGDATAWTLPGRIAEPPDQPVALDNLERDAVASSLDLEAIRYRLSAAGDRVGLARLDRWLPELGVGVTAERDDGHWGVGPAVVLEIPLWDRNRGAIAQSEARLAQQQNQYAALAVDVRAQARAAGQRLKAARERALAYRDRLLPLRAELLEQTLQAHNAMTATTFEVLAAKRRQIEASSDYLDALLDYWLAHAAVEQIRAGRRPGMPESPSSSATDEDSASPENH